MNFHFLEPARDELVEAVEFYEQRLVGLGKEFAQEVQISIEKILDDPESWPQTSKNIRRCRTSRFPYAILYHVQDEVMFIVAVMHLHRKPGYWKDRIS